MKQLLYCYNCKIDTSQFVKGDVSTCWCGATNPYPRPVERRHNEADEPEWLYEYREDDLREEGRSE